MLGPLAKIKKEQHTSLSRCLVEVGRSILARVERVAHALYRKEGEAFVALNPGGSFLAARTCVPLKVEDPGSENHLVLTVGDRELTVRPGVRQH